MSFVPFPTGVMEAILNFNVSGISAIMTMGVLKSDLSATTTADGIAVANIIDNWFTTFCAADLSVNTEILNTTVNDLTSPTGWTATGGDPHTGAVTGEAVPNQVAMVVTLLSGLRGRSFRGRNYVPGLPNSALLSPTQWTVAARNNWSGNYIGLLGLFGASPYEMVILSRFFNGAPRTLGDYVPVLDVEAKQQIATQRRRLR